MIVGGTGMIGGHIALGLRREGHQVTLASRKPAQVGTVLADFDFIPGNYVDDDFTRGQLEGFDNLVFAACKDVREAPTALGKAEEDAFYKRSNSEAVPRFFALARDAGIRRAAYIGSFYPQVCPDLVGTSGYIRSRLDADEGARALAGPDFHVVSLNAPWVIGALPGIPSAFCGRVADWALGRLPQVPFNVSKGGSNFISLQSLYESVMGGLTRGENGRGYLVGDENLYFSQFFQLFFKAAGRSVELSIGDQEMGILPDRALFAGRNGTIFYTPEGVESLGYRQHDIERAVHEIVESGGQA